MQAIKTVYLGPTNTKPSRIKASSLHFNITRCFDSELSVAENHRLVANELSKQLKWSVDCELVSGQLAEDVYVHTFSPVMRSLKLAVFETRFAMTAGDLGGNPHCKAFGKAVHNLTTAADATLLCDFMGWVGAKE